MNTKQLFESGTKLARLSSRFKGAIPVLLLLILTGFFINGLPQGREAMQATVLYDGVTLFRGLAFGSGPVGSKVPTIQKVNSKLPQDYKNLESKVVDYIKQKDPGFFESFANDLQSGDRTRVADALRRSHKIQREALLEVTKGSTTQVATELRRMPAEDAAGRRSAASAEEPTKDLAVIVILYAPVVLDLVAKNPNMDEMKGLTFDRYVDEVVRSLPRTQKLRR